MKRITIKFPKDRDKNFYFRVFCWADGTLSPSIEKPGDGEISNLDHVTEEVIILVKRPQSLSNS